VPNQALRLGLLAQLRAQPWAFWEEPIPVFAGWPDAPCAYLRFAPNPAYDAEVSGGHFHMLVDPTAVTGALLDLVRRLAYRTGR
jgi:hypothetical protein